MIVLDPFNWSWLLGFLADHLLALGTSAAVSRLRPGWQARVWKAAVSQSKLEPLPSKRAFAQWLARADTWQALTHPSETAAEQLSTAVLALSSPTSSDDPARMDEARMIVAATWLSMVREIPESGWREIQLAILDDIKAIQAAMYDRIAQVVRDWETQSILYTPTLETSRASKMNFASRAIPFVNRPATMALLEAFITRPEPVLWTLMIGAGGVGKSRIALEFGLSLEGWTFGFLSEMAEPPDLASWQPSQPTLIIVDYLSRQAEIARGLILNGLSRQAESPRQRFLFLDRERSSDLERRLIGSGQNQYAIEAVESDSIPLLGLFEEEAWQLVVALSESEGKPAPERSQAMNQLRQMDPGLTPFNVALAIDTYFQEAGVWHVDRNKLLRDVLRREDNFFWRPAHVSDNDKNLLALATVEGGLSFEEVVSTQQSAFGPPLTDLDLDRFASVYGSRPFDKLEPLEPDLIGEFFVLEHLQVRSTLDHRIDHLLTTAWARSPMQVSDFISRCVSDFVDHPTLEKLLLSPGVFRSIFDWQAAMIASVPALVELERLKLACSLQEIVLTEDSLPQLPDEVMQKIPARWLDDPASMDNVGLAYSIVPGGIDWDSVLRYCAYMFDTRLVCARTSWKMVPKLAAAQLLDEAIRIAHLTAETAKRRPKEIGIAQAAAWSLFECLIPLHDAGRELDAIAMIMGLIEFGSQWPKEPAIIDAVSKGAVNSLNILSGLQEPERTVLWKYLWALQRGTKRLRGYPSHHRLAEALAPMVSAVPPGRWNEVDSLYSAVDTLAEDDQQFNFLKAEARIPAINRAAHEGDRAHAERYMAQIDAIGTKAGIEAAAKYLKAQACVNLSAILSEMGDDEGAVEIADQITGFADRDNRTLVHECAQLAYQNIVTIHCQSNDLDGAEHYLNIFGQLLKGGRFDLSSNARAYPDAVWHVCHELLAMGLNDRAVSLARRSIDIVGGKKFIALRHELHSKLESLVASHANNEGS